jgi:hypothetical protein
VKHLKYFYNILLLLIFISPSFAFNKLTPTDVLNRREYEFQIDYSFLTTALSGGYYDNLTRSAALAFTNMSIGLSDGIELNIGLPYFFSDNTVLKSSSGNYSEEYKSFGAGDLILATTFGLLRENPASGLFAVQVGLKPATAPYKPSTPTDVGTKGTGTTDFFIGFTGSKRFVSAEPYYTLFYNFNGEKKAESEPYVQLALGNEILINKYTSIDMKALSVFHTGSLSKPFDDIRSLYQLQLSAYFDTPLKFTIIPAFSYVFENNIPIDLLGHDTENSQGWMFSLGLYSLFGGMTK